MVRKELYVYLLAYNLLRTLMWEAGTTYGVTPLHLSLQGTRHHLEHFTPKLLAACEGQRYHIYRTLLKVIEHTSQFPLALVEVNHESASVAPNPTL
jgi:hypothetical protein